MTILPVPRRAAALTVALAAAAAAALAGAAPAGAADPTDPVLTMQQPQTQAVATAAAQGAATTINPSLMYTISGTSVNTQATITIDARRLAKIADVTFSDNCTVQQSVATCSEFLWWDDVSPNSRYGLTTQMQVSAKAGVAAGAAASYTVSGTADHATIVGTSGSVQIGGPAFAQTGLTGSTGLAVGSTVSEPLEFTNRGDRPAAAAQALLMASPGLTFADHFANCTYSSVPNDRQAEEALCTFPGPIQIGEHVALATPVRLNVTSTAYATYLDALTAPKGDPSIAAQTADRTWTKGTDTNLGLTVLDPGQAGTVPAGKVSLDFTDGSSDYAVASLRAVNTADFSVTGSSAQAAVGSTVEMDFSMLNNGPATIFNRGGDGIGVSVTPPPGTTIVGSSANCQPSQSDNPQVTAHGPYACNGGYLVPAGQATSFSLTLRVDSVVAGATGTAAMDWGDPSWRPDYDQNAADDSATLTLN
ncbi:hypothetical protein [Actinacidiphila acidipaludis]|uniref:Choice-of-anchor D domain-containing protein n=1 Tax=Actinacidiphila acidipaludis TaxID=2873382 RepID=A0ABS7Q1G0_9ACTN|nr:hypothetical protein [Streptomyces acidipaludis]MBY8876285.1 hypothetical protein [Streptomyces acidipaludis]